MPRAGPRRSVTSLYSWSSIARARHSASRAVGVVADRLVVGADRLCDGAGGGADGEEPPCDLLPRADLGEATVDRSLEVDRQRLGVGVFGGVKLAHLASHPPPAGGRKQLCYLRSAGRGALRVLFVHVTAPTNRGIWRVTSQTGQAAQR